MITADLPLVATWGALIGLAVSITLIILKLHPCYSLIIGAIIGGLTGLAGLEGTITYIMSGASSMVKPILRILTSGILAGALIKTGSAEKIASSIIKLLGNKLALIAIAVSTMIICAVGVFIDISVITIAPIALTIAAKTKTPKSAVLIAMIGGGKAGNIISPNPNTIATANAYNIPLTDLIIRNIVPAVFALGVTILIAYILNKKKNDFVEEENTNENKENEFKRETKKEETKKLPNIFQALAGPIVVIVLLILRPTANIDIDPLIALPAGGLITILVTGKVKQIIDITGFGLSKVSGIAILLLGTGALAGIISNSNLQFDLQNLINAMNMPAFLLAPISGFLMAAATASTTSGATIASETFSKVILQGGVSAVGAAAMTHASSTIIDSLPHGSFFHATGGSVSMNFKDRLKLIPFEACIGLTSTIVSVIVYLIIG